MPLLLKEKINQHSSWALWHIKEDPESLQQLFSLSKKEKEELELLKSDQRKLEWLGSRLLLKELSRDFNLPDREVMKDSFGKPHLEGLETFISLSHSFPFAAAIIHTKKAVGIDIEHSREQLLRIRHKFLNAAELDCAGNQLGKLCVYWTAKEALYKLYGKRGLILKEQILVSPFELAENGQLDCQLLLNGAKEQYTLHYRQLMDLHICYSL